jgi:N-acetylmuramoyl-L-alanine amidase
VTIIDLPSPNHDARAAGVPIDILVLHYTGLESGASARARLVDLASRVSAHYLIEEDGRVFRLVAEERRAWHAGVSFWRGARDINSRSIGVELVNPGHEFGYRDFPREQMAALIALAHEILARHPISARNVVGHSDVAPARKIDPGERFDWPALAAAGIGLWPPRTTPPSDASSFSFGPNDKHADVLRAQADLAAYGYDSPRSGAIDDATLGAIIAFQRHFQPWRFDGRLDGETRARLGALLALCRAI